MSIGKCGLWVAMLGTSYAAQATDLRDWSDHLAPVAHATVGLTLVNARYMDYVYEGSSFVGGTAVPGEVELQMAKFNGVVSTVGLTVGGDVPIYVRRRLATGIYAHAGFVGNRPLSHSLAGLGGFALHHAEGAWVRWGKGRQEPTINVTARLGWLSVGGALPYNHPTLGIELGFEQNSIRVGLQAPLVPHRYFYGFTDGRIEPGIRQRNMTLYVGAAY